METLQYPTKVKANKQHRCNYCNMHIEKGEVYNKSSYKNDGEIYTWKAHLRCDEIADKLKMHENSRDSGYDGLTGEFFDETIRIEYDDIVLNRYGFKDKTPTSFKHKLDTVLNHHDIKPTPKDI